MTEPRRPSPTSRARRSGAVAPEPLRRPSPRPVAQPATVDPGTEHLDSPELDSKPAELISQSERRRRAPRLWLAPLLVLLILALAALDGWLLVSRPQAGSRAQRDQALATAKTAVPLILSYNYRHFDSDVRAAKARLTGRATTDYVQAMAKTIKPTAAKVHAVVQAQTDGAGVESVAGNGKQVTVVVFGEQKVSNTALTAPRIDLFRVRVTLDKVGDQWLVSKFDQI